MSADSQLEILTYLQLHMLRKVLSCTDAVCHPAQHTCFLPAAAAAADSGRLAGLLLLCQQPGCLYDEVFAVDTMLWCLLALVTQALDGCCVRRASSLAGRLLLLLLLGGVVAAAAGVLVHGRCVLYCYILLHTYSKHLIADLLGQSKAL